MARSFNEKMEKKRQAEYNRWKAECNPVWHRRNHWLPKYEEEGTWEDSRAYNVELGCDLKGYVETVRTYNAAPVENLTDEDYAFWLDVRNTYAEINGKATKEYTREQMLAWYNKLHSDSAEYKMWGNGIALPNALYVMQGIAEVVGVHHSK